MRVFLAVHPDPRFVRDLTTQLDPWRSALAVKWTLPVTWHVTLQFLGEWPADRLKVLQEALSRLEAGPPFELVPGPLGGFPNLRAPRVLFLQMDSGGRAERLARLVRDCVAEVWPDGPQDRKAFRGHLTLARIKRRLTGAEGDLLARLELEPFAPVRVESFHLIASELFRDGPRYTELTSYRMRKKGE